MSTTKNLKPTKDASGQFGGLTDGRQALLSRSRDATQRSPAGRQQFSDEELTLLLDLSQVLLDIVGIFEPTPFADGTNAIISFKRGDQVGGWLSLISVVPYVGDLAKIGKFPKYTAVIEKVIRCAARNPAFARIVRPRLAELSEALSLIAGLQNSIGQAAKKLNDKLIQFLGKSSRAIKGGLRGGMTAMHYNAVLRVAKQRGLVIMFRNADEACEKYIQKGFPPKPLEIKAKTVDGIATAKNTSEQSGAIEAGMMVISKDGKSVLHQPPGSLEVLVKPIPKDLMNIPGYKPLPGHVIHPNLKQPFTGDYDLLAIVDPKDFNSNAVGIKMGGPSSKSLSNPFDDEVIADLNKAIGESRVVHGGWEHFAKLRDGGDVTVFLPDGKSTLSFASGSKEFMHFFNSFAR